MASVQITDYSLGFHIDSQGKTVFDRADISLKAEGLDPSQKVTVHLYQGISQSVNSQILYFPMLQIPSGTGSFGLGDAVRSTDLDMDSNYIKLHVSGYPAATLDVTGAHSLQKGKSYTATKAGGFKESTVINPTNSTAMKERNYFLGAIGALVRFGKNNGLISWTAGKFSILKSNGTDLANLAVADAVAGEDAVNLKQVNEKLAELAKQGAMVVADLTASSNPWGDNEIRVTADLKFQRSTPSGTDAFTPADGTVISTAKKLAVNSGHIMGGGTELLPDHIYLYDAPTGKLYDNGAIGSERNTAKKLPVFFDSSGAATGISAIPANAHVIGAEVIVNEGFDGTVSGLKLDFGSGTLVDFSLFDLSETAKMPVPAYFNEAAGTEPKVSGSITGGSRGKAVVLVEYVIS